MVQKNARIIKDYLHPAFNGTGHDGMTAAYARRCECARC